MTDETSTEVQLPKFFKDETGFCYVATERLAEQPGLTAWNGAVDAAGYATDEAPAPAVGLQVRAAKPKK